MSESISIIRASKSELTYIVTAASAKSAHHRLVALLDTTGDAFCLVMHHIFLIASQHLHDCLRAELLSKHSTTSRTSKRS